MKKETGEINKFRSYVPFWIILYILDALILFLFDFNYLLLNLNHISLTLIMSFYLLIFFLRKILYLVSIIYRAVRTLDVKSCTVDVIIKRWICEN